MSRIFAALVAVLLACSCTLPALAATSSLVRGVVSIDGKPAGGVKVTLEGEGSRFDTTSDAQGNYVFSQVPFGHYRLSAKSGSLPELAFDVTVTSDSVSTINLALSK